MPKLRLSDTEKSNALLRGCIKKGKEVTRMNDEQLIKRIGMTRRTFYNRKSRPGTYSLDEFRVLCSILKFSDDEILSIVKKSS